MAREGNCRRYRFGRRIPLLAWLARQAAAASIALVGHAPDLGQLVSYLICGCETPALKIKKGGACLVTFSHDLQPGEGTLRWLMDVIQLGKLAV